MEPTISASSEHFVVRFRDSARFDEVLMPEWAQSIAAEVVPGSHVRMGELGTDAVIQSIAIPRSRVGKREEALGKAQEIERRVSS